MHARLDREIDRRHFHVAIFGSARITKDATIYKEIYDLARLAS